MSKSRSRRSLLDRRSAIAHTLSENVLLEMRAMGKEKNEKDSAMKIQRVIRGRKIRAKFQKSRKAAISIQKKYRDYVHRVERLSKAKAVLSRKLPVVWARFKAKKRVETCATKLQALWKCHQKKREFRVRRKSSIDIQRHVRRMLCKKKFISKVRNIALEKRNDSVLVKMKRKNHVNNHNEEFSTIHAHLKQTRGFGLSSPNKLLKQWSHRLESFRNELRDLEPHEKFQEQKKIQRMITLMCRRVPESTSIQVLCAMLMDKSTRYDTQTIKKHLLDEHFLVDVWSLGRYLNLESVFRIAVGEDHLQKQIEEKSKKPFAKSSFFRFTSSGSIKNSKKKKKKKKKKYAEMMRSSPRKNLRLADMLEQEISKVGERDRLEATRSELLAIQSGRRTKGDSPIIRHRDLPEVELEHPMLMEEWQREYLYGF